MSGLAIRLMSNLNKPDQKTSKWQAGEAGGASRLAGPHAVRALIWGGGAGRGRRGNQRSHLQY